MESYGKHKYAAGRDPDFGAIFMTSRATLRECFQRRLFGLPSSQMPFVKQVKAGMLLFLFDYDNRELYGVYKSSSDGAMNIVPSAFSSSGRQFPAQVEFSPIWDCKPLKESKFRDAIRENYFSAKKFHMGLSEKQVHRLLDLFSKRKLPGRQVKPDHYPVGKVGRSVGGRMHAEIVKNEQDVVASTLPLTMHNYKRDSFHYTGEVDDEEHSISMQLRPAISGGLSGNFPGAATVHDDMLHVSERLLSDHKTTHGQRFLDDTSSLHNSNVSSFFFSSNPVLDPDSLVQNQLVATSAMPHLIHAPISDKFCVAQGNLSSKSILLYDPDAPASNTRQPSSVRISINDSSKPMGVSASPSNNYRRNIMCSLDDQLSYAHAELKDANQSQGCSYGLNNPVSFESNLTSMTLCAAQNSERLATKPVEYEDFDSSPFKSSSGLFPHLGIGNSGWSSEPYASLCDKYNTHSSNDYCPMALQENLGHDEMTLQKNSETFSAMPWGNEGHSQSQYDDPLLNEHDHDFECYVNSGSPYSGYKNKTSVFSRLCFVHPFNNKKYGSNHSHRGYDVSLDSVDEVMDMVRQSRNHRGIKRKINPWVKVDKAESMGDRKIRSSGSSKASSGNSLDDTSMGVMIAAGDSEINQIDEGTRFVDFKRRSQVRRNNEIQIRGSDENVRSDDLRTVQQKKRRLIRPNFSKGPTPGDKKDISLGSSQNLQASLSLQNLEPKGDSKSCEVVIRTEENLKIDCKELNLVSQKHFRDTSDQARGVNSEEGNQREGQSLHKTGLNDGSDGPEHIHIHHASSSAFCEGRGFHDKEGSCVKDDIKPIFSDTELRHSICQPHNKEKVIGASGYINTGEGTLLDGQQLLPPEVEGVPEFEKNSDNEPASNLTCEKSNCNIEKGSNMKHESQEASGVADSSDGKQLLPTEVEDAPEYEKNSNNEGVSNLTCKKRNSNVEKGSNMNHESQEASGVAESSDGKQLLSEVEEVPESEKNFVNENASNLTYEKRNSNIEKGSSMNRASQETSGVAECSELCKDGFENKKGASFHV
ncbi:uncharacterized protein LOC114718219 [Neltuma alba]|uniref:uncharacterized protein LOC114718219 n=1 Tax=Neltuma alba TaxID=207710 RepID=UPI0010A3797B|nr:uncharacterized protein LOC114718219 [Prosopis alba]XP_028759311.1 uncharacterized protein LOC114718219 [Prosopis alba]XP_028759312.1 uncharacterized protein LOC114718219 [Prosopis alba]